MKLLNFTDFLFESEKSTFGIFSEGASPIVIVAPHAVEEDDEHTKEIAEQLAMQLNAFLVINDTFHKPCKTKCEYDEDFNHLPPMKDGELDWSKRVPEMKTFYDTIEQYAKKANVLSKDNNKRCLVLYIHGLKHDKYDIDLGAGVQSAPNMTINAEQHVDSKGNSGDVTAPIKFVEHFRDVLKKAGLNVGTGDVFSAWDGQNGTQYLKLKGIDCYSIQIELNTTMRGDVKKTVGLISSAVKELKDFSESVFYLPQEVK